MNKQTATILCLFGIIGWQAANAAATCTWTGAGADNKWSTSANWNVCGGAHALPVDGDSLVFPAGVPRLSNSNDLSNLTVAQLAIGGSASLSGNAIKLTVGVVANVPVIAATAPSIHLGVSLLADAQVQCAGDKSLTLSGTVNLGGHTLTLNSGCTIFVVGNVNGAGGITKIGTGSALLEGAASSYAGVTTVSGGKLRTISDVGLGASGPGNETIVSLGASLELEAVTLDETLSLGGSGSGGEGALYATPDFNRVDANILLTANTTIGGSAGSDLTLSGDISGGFSLTKNGAGTLIVEGSTPFFTVSGGVLEVDGTTAGAVVKSTSLAGSGVLTGTLSLGYTASVAPGSNSGTHVGRLYGTNLSWAGSGTMAFQLGATPALSDQIVISGTLSKSASGTFAFEFSDAATPPTPGVTYVLFIFDSQAGFSASDFSFTYIGTGPGATMDGVFELTPTILRFTPSLVVSDLIFRDGME